MIAVDKAVPPPVLQQDSSVSVHDEAQVDVMFNAELEGETVTATSTDECPDGENGRTDHDATDEGVTDVGCEEPAVPQQDSSVSVHGVAQVDVLFNAELEGETMTATSTDECPAGEIDQTDLDATEEGVTDVGCEEPPVPQQDGSGVGLSIDEGDNAVDQLAATATEDHFDDVLEQLPIQTMQTDSDTTSSTMSMSTTALSPQSHLQTLVNVNDGKCNVFGCCNPVFIACHSCNEFLCYDHTSSSCLEHSHVYTLPASFCNAKFITVIVGETGEEFQVPVENETDQQFSCSKNGMTGPAPVTDNSDKPQSTQSLESNVVTDDSDVSEPGLEPNVFGKAPSRWKKKNPELYQRNIQRKNRAHGLAYKKYRGVPGSATVPAKAPQKCNCVKCRFKCCQNFPEDVREAICRDFYKLGDYSRQKDYIVSHVVEVKPKYRLLTSNKPHQISRAYYLSANGVRHRVCSNFFVKTLDIKLRGVQKFLSVNQDCTTVGSVPDRRGKHSPPNKTKRWKTDLIRQHISLFPTMESHYCRSTTKRKYLDSKLTIAKMYEQFRTFFEQKLPSDESDREVPSENVYRDIFCTEFNLGFFIPKKDQCALCSQKKQYEGDPQKMAALQEHLRQKDRAQDEKRRDKAVAAHDESCLLATFDMQSVLQLPVSEVGVLYYKRKLVLHNFTVYDNTAPHKAHCYLWTETDGKRGANEIGSCLLRYLQSLNECVKHVTFFSDSCSGQNRNQFVCALLLYAVTVLPIDVIDHKFLVPGHTMMECDSMHSSIEYARKHLSLYTVNDWVNVIKSARRHNPYEVEVMKFADFSDLKYLAVTLLCNRRKASTGELVNWMAIRWIRVEKAKPNVVFFKTDFDQTEFGALVQKKTRSRPLQLLGAYKKSLPISKSKHTDLMSMLKEGIIPHIYSEFYSDIPFSAKVVDCVPDVDDEEVAD